MEEYIQISTMTGKKETAEEIAKALVKKRLSACVQIVGPVLSVYWWKGKIETNREWLCLIKSERSLLNTVETAIKEIHPYETPEIIAIPIVAVSSEYLGWLEDTLKKK
jgi:periplasmic divalent cation tolerance protein